MRIQQGCPYTVLYIIAKILRTSLYRQGFRVLTDILTGVKTEFWAVFCHKNTPKLHTISARYLTGIHH